MHIRLHWFGSTFPPEYNTHQMKHMDLLPTQQRGSIAAAHTTGIAKLRHPSIDCQSLCIVWCFVVFCLPRAVPLRTLRPMPYHTYIHTYIPRLSSYSMRTLGGDLQQPGLRLDHELRFWWHPM